MGRRTDRVSGCEGGWRRFGLPSFVLVGQLLLGVTAASAQQMAAGAAVVRVPPVAQMEVEPIAASTVRLASSSQATGAFRIAVRANHGWEIKVAAASAPGGVGTLWVRVTDRAGGGEFRRVEPGTEVPVAAGGMGESVIRLDYRWVSAAGSETPVAPLTYTLASR